MSSSSFQSAQSSPSHCLCGIPVAKKQSWTSKNPGRRFATCQVYNPVSGVRGCDYFQWIDDEMVEWQRVVINHLLLEKKLLEKEKEILKSEVCNLEDSKSNLIRDLDGIRRKCKKLASLEKRSKGIKVVAVNSSPLNWVIGVVMGVICILFLAIVSKKF